MDISEVLKPAVSENLAIDLVRRLYGLNVTSIKRLVSFDDQNFHIKVSKEYENPYITKISENGYTLKITNTMKTAQEGHFDSMHYFMTHLANKGLSIPEPVRNLEGKTWTKEDVPLLNAEANTRGQKLCGVQLLTFISGTVVASFEYTKEVLYQWGELLAKFHNAVADIKYPALLSKSILWDLNHIPELENYLDAIEEHRRPLVLNVLRKYPSEITQNFEELSKGFIHGDFNERNVLMQKKSSEKHEESYTVNGILDLEDIQYGTYVWDIGVMLAYTLLECNKLDPLEGAGHALAGYLSLRSLTDLEISTTKMCAECRLCQSLVLCAASYKNDPNNSYLLTSAKTGWSRLEQITTISKEDLMNKWRRMRKNYQSKIL